MEKKKKRLDHQRLVQAGKDARDILANRGIIKKDEQSLIAQILQDPTSPPLPGGGGSPVSPQPYVPRPHTINIARRIMGDLMYMWNHDVDDNDERKMNGIEFFKFIVIQMNIATSKVNTAIVKTVESKEYNQTFLSRQETINAVKGLFIDSFAISVIAGTCNDVADFYVWFRDWTERLLNLWPKDQQWIDNPNALTDYAPEHNQG